jgi:hypothetical protein
VIRAGHFAAPTPKERFRHHEARLCVTRFAAVGDGSSGAAGDHLEFIDFAELHSWAKLVPECPEAISTGNAEAADYGEFSAAA